MNIQLSLDIGATVVAVANILIITFLAWRSRVKDIQNSKANEMNNKLIQNYQYGHIEILIANDISNARANENITNLELAKFLSTRKQFEKDEDEKKNRVESISIIQGVLNSNKEEYLNAYDRACQFYLDKKVDEDRFRKRYYFEIQTLFLDKSPHLTKLNGNNQASYSALHLVYKKWFNFEK